MSEALSNTDFISTGMRIEGTGQSMLLNADKALSGQTHTALVDGLSQAFVMVGADPAEVALNAQVVQLQEGMPIIAADRPSLGIQPKKVIMTKVSPSPQNYRPITQMNTNAYLHTLTADARADGGSQNSAFVHGARADHRP